MKLHYPDYADSNGFSGCSDWNHLQNGLPDEFTTRASILVQWRSEFAFQPPSLAQLQSYGLFVIKHIEEGFLEWRANCRFVKQARFLMRMPLLLNWITHRESNPQQS